MSIVVCFQHSPGRSRRPMSKPPSSRRAITALCFVGLMVDAISATILGTALPFIGGEFQLTLAMMGALAGAWNLGYLFTVVGGSLSDRYGEVAVLTLSFVLLFVPIGLMAMANNYLICYALLIVAGVGGAFVEASVNPLLSNMYPEKRGMALNILHVFWGIGAFIGPALAGLTISSLQNWRVVYSISAVLYIPLILVSIRLLKRNTVEPSGSRRRAINSTSFGFRVLKSRVLVLLTFAGFFYFGSELGVNAWLPSFLMMDKSFPLTLASFSTSLFWASMGFGRLIFAGVVDRVGYRKTMLTCSLFGALSIFLGTVLEHSAAIVVSWCIAGFSLAPILPTILAWASSMFPRSAGVASGAIFSIGITGAVLSPWIVGVASERASFQSGMVYLVFSTLVIAFCCIAIRERRGMSLENMSKPMPKD